MLRYLGAVDSIGHPRSTVLHLDHGGITRANPKPARESSKR